MSYGGTSIDIGGGVVKYEKLKDGVLVITLNKPERMNGWPIVGPNGSNAWYDAYDMQLQILMYMLLLLWFRACMVC